MPLELVSSFTMAPIFNIDSKKFEICNGRRQKGKKARRQEGKKARRQEGKKARRREGKKARRREE
ncbi:predicted protein [Botrytis cinerea T4]|uniref:Uncharacterized protein n=1 Tax=Botryotinia fuckeliana (strain T4) TaxID=999810 RepID=G2Y4C2_BOTF4|nr:predicted protein [Botrytis cinerea T4]